MYESYLIIVNTMIRSLCYMIIVHTMIRHLYYLIITQLCIVVVSHCLSSFVIVTKEPPSLRTAKKISDVWPGEKI